MIHRFDHPQPHIEPTAHPSPTILLLPGLSGDPRIWARLAPRIAVGNTPVWVGESFADTVDRAGNTWTVEAFAEATMERISNSGLNNIVLVSHSAGIFAAVEMAVSRPDLVRAVVAINGGLTLPLSLLNEPLRTGIKHPIVSARTWQLFAMLGVPTPPIVRRLLASSVLLSAAVVGAFVGSEGQADADLLRSLITDRADPQVLRALFVNRHYQNRFTQLVSKVRQQTLLISGGHDPIAKPGETGILAGKFGVSEIRNIAGSGHAIPLEAPLESATAILSVLAQVVGTRSAV